MNKYITIYVLLIVTLLASCEDELEVSDPTTIGQDQFITDMTTAQQAVDGIYDGMQDVYVAGAYPIMSLGLYADEFAHSGSYGIFDELVINNAPATNTAVANFWFYRYKVIFRANAVINEMESVTGIDESDKNAIIAEAKGLRALMYFDLVRMFGGVPLPQENDLVSNNGASAANVSRSSEQEVYDYILADLLDAQGNIADSDVYHFSNDALNVLLAKVYMNQEDYENATTILESVIGEYSLVSDYSSVFSNGSNSESIFRVNYSTDDQNSLAFYFYPSGLGGRREVAPSSNLLDAFVDGDNRISLIANADDLSSTYIAKYSDVSTGTDQRYIYRYAEVELLYAELLARNGDFDTASTYINDVRSRAGLDEVELNSSNFIALISKERRLEFFAEGKRWYDAKRLNILDEVVENKGTSSLNTNRQIWPIPQSEINANKEMSQESQNQGY